MVVGEDLRLEQVLEYSKKYLTRNSKSDRFEKKLNIWMQRV